jgi:hypothetical protein
MAARNSKRKRKQLELVETTEVNTSDLQVAPLAPVESAAVDADQPPSQIGGNNKVQTEEAPTMQAPTFPSAFEQEVAAANAPYCEVERVSLKQRVSNLARGVQGLLASAKEARKARRDAALLKVGASVSATSTVDEDDVSSPVVQEEGLVTQINDRDREYMQAFPAQLKARVMHKILSQEPEENVVYQGNNRFEIAMMNIHRDGYGLIDMQPHETAFSSVWYRKGRKLTGKSAEVIMLMWEEGDHGETTTVANWKL